MPHINIDSILSKMAGWDLSIGIDGKSVPVSAPSLENLAMLQCLERGSNPKDVENHLRGVIAPLIPASAGVDPSTWKLEKLVAVTHTIVQHAKQSFGKNLAGIGQAVKEAFAGQSPTAQASTPAPMPLNTSAPAAQAPATQPKN